MRSNKCHQNMVWAIIVQNIGMLLPLLLYWLLVKPEISPYPVILAGLGVSGLVQWSNRSRMKHKYMIPAICVILIVLLSIMMHKTLSGGMAWFLNGIIECIRQEYARNYTLYAETASVTGKYGIMILLTVVWAIIYELLPVKRLLTGVVLAVYAILGIGCIHISGRLYWVILAAAGLFSLTWQITARPKGEEVPGVEQQAISIHAAAGGWIRMLLLPSVILLLSAGLWTQKDLPGKDTLRESMKQGIEAIRYGRLSGTGMREGRLAEAGDRVYSSETVLKVTMEEPDSYYLRGYVGEVYEDNSWNHLETEERYPYADAFYWLHQSGFYGQSQISTAAIAADADLIEYTNTITIENTGLSSRYLYTPYELLEDTDIEDEKAIGDAELFATGIRGVRNYDCRAANAMITQYRDIAGELSYNDTTDKQEYLKSEADYNQYVYQNDLQIPSDVRSYLTDTLGNYQIDPGEVHMDYQTAKQNVLYYLTTEMTYQEQAEPVGKDVDFILQFMDGTKAGYDIHYASAAVMMLRYYGIPARYVEGVLITPEDIADMKPGGTLLLDGSHVHAWVEYYQDGVGWLPFEVTPAYLTVMEPMDGYQDITGMLGQSESENEQQENIEPDTQTNPEPDTFKSFWLENKLQIILGIVIVIAVIILILFAAWIVSERKKAARRKAGFREGTPEEGICAIYEYIMELLCARGISIKNCPPEEYAMDLEEALRESYIRSTRLWKEARFSSHEMAESQREEVLIFMYALWDDTWKRAGWFGRLKLKYMLFL